MKRVCFINGSLRGDAAASLKFLHGVDQLLADTKFEKPIIAVRALIPGGYPEEILKMMGSADALVIAFPLFSYSLPGALMRLLEDYGAYATQNGGGRRAARVYGIVNCGFAGPEINAEAIRVLQSFCRRTGLEWRFALSIGCGPVAVFASVIPFLRMRIRRGFREITNDIREDCRDARATFMVKPFIPKKLGIVIRDQMERKAQMRFEKKMKLNYGK